MKKLLMITAMLMMVLLQAGCSTKTEYVYIKSKPFEFQTVEQPKVRAIDVRTSHLKLYEAYIKNFRDIIDFQNKQILDYQNSFKDENKTTQEQ